MKKKYSLAYAGLAFCAFTAVGALLLGTNLSNVGSFKVKGDLSTYQLVFNSSKNVLTTSDSPTSGNFVATTELGNPVTINYDGTSHETGWVTIIPETSVIKNESPISGIISITPVFTGSSELSLSYGWEDDSLNFSGTLLSGTAFNFDNAPSYFSITNDNDSNVTISELVITYSCEIVDHNYVNEDWTEVKGIGNHYYFDDYVGETPLIHADNGIILDHERFLINDTVVGENYDVSVTAYGNQNWPITNESHIGIVPWYVDSNNFLVAYSFWSNTDRPNGIRSWEINGYLDGAFIGWKTRWGDDPNLASAIRSPNNESTYKIEARKLGSNTTFKFYFCDQLIDSRDIATGSKEARFGVYARGNDTFTFKNASYSIAEAATPQFEILPSGTPSVRASGDTITYDVGLDSENWLIGAAVAPVISLADSANYTMSAHLSATRTTPISGMDMYMGFCVYYKDTSNYLLAYIQFAEGSAGYVRNMGLTGYINNAWTNWGDLWNFANLKLNSTDFDLSVRRSGNTFSCSLEGISQSITISQLDTNSQTSRLGLWGQRAGVITATNYTVA